MTSAPISPTDAERRHRAANLKRRLALLRHHAALRDPVTGKSLQAVRGGQAAWRMRVEAAGGNARIVGLEMALKRWHPEGDGSDGREAARC